MSTTVPTTTQPTGLTPVQAEELLDLVAELQHASFMSGLHAESDSMSWHLTASHALRAVTDFVVSVTS